MKAMVYRIFASVSGLALLVTLGCRDSANNSEIERLTGIPALNDARAGLSSSELSALANRFRVIPLQTNDVRGIAIIDTEKNEPIWMEWYPGQSTRPDQICYCFGGKPIVELYLMTNTPPRRSVIYYDTNGLEKLIVGDRSGVGIFTDRIFYEDGRARLEWWYDEAWHPVVERNKRRGIEIDGKWTELELPNGILVPVASE